MEIIFTELAKLELEAAFSFYEQEAVGLGLRFQTEIRKAVIRIAAYPYAWARERGAIRKCLLHVFPYKLLYSIEHGHILVLAVAHLHRKPNYWAKDHEG